MDRDVRHEYRWFEFREAMAWLVLTEGRTEEQAKHILDDAPKRIDLDTGRVQLCIQIAR